MTFTAGARLGPYELTALIGVGGMGALTVVVTEPWAERPLPLRGRLIRRSVGPLSQECLDKAFGLSVRARRLSNEGQGEADR